MRYTLLTATFVAAVAAVQAQTAANISTTELTPAGFSEDSMQNAVSNTYFANDGRTILAVKGGASAVTATLKTQAATAKTQAYGDVPLADETVSIPAGDVIIMGPFPQGRWNNQYGLVRVSFTSVTGISASAMKVRP